MKAKNYVYIWLMLFLLVSSVTIGILFRWNLQDCGISQISNIAEVKQCDVRLNYTWEKGDEYGITSIAEEAMNGTSTIFAASIIAIVAPTGNIHQTEGSFGQEIAIKKVLYGSEDLVGQVAYVYQNFGFSAASGRVEFLNTLNVMYPENEYLIFMDESPLNPYQQRPVFLLRSEYLGYIRTDFHTTKTLTNTYKGILFSDLNEYEFFSESETITDALNTARSFLLRKYLN